MDITWVHYIQWPRTDREDSPNDHFIPLTDQTNRRMLFDGHKQKLFGMSSTILVSPKMPPTNRRGRSADQQRTWTRLTYGRSSFSPVQDALHKNGLVQSWGSTKGLLLLHILPIVVKVVLTKTSAPVRVPSSSS